MRAAGRTITDDADLVALLDVFFDQVADMAEHATDGRAETVNDAQGRTVIRHVSRSVFQKKRSRT
ncbi:hypothetical protein D3C87_1490020 [compost metagenome]